MHLITYIFAFITIIFIVCHPFKTYKIVWRKNLVENIIVFFWVLLNSIYILYSIKFPTNIEKLVAEFFSLFTNIQFIIYFNLFMIVIAGVYYYKNTASFLKHYLKLLKIVYISGMANLIYFAHSTKYNTIEMNNFIGFVILFLSSNILLNIEDVQYSINKKNSSLCYNNIIKIREPQKKELIGKIRSFSGNEQLFVFVSDEWGGGKSFFIEEVINGISDIETFHIIKLDALNMNNKELFVKNLFSKIRNELKSKRFFLNNKEINKYFDPIIQIALGNEAKDLFHVLLEKLWNNCNTDDISIERSLKELSDLLGDHMLILIIDNIDLCASNIIEDIFSFFNDILNLPQSIIITLGCWEKMIANALIKNDNPYTLFSYVYNLERIPYSLLLNEMQESFNNISKEWGNSYNIAQIVTSRIDFIKQSIFKKQLFCDEGYTYLKSAHIRNKILNETEDVCDNLKSSTHEIERRLSNAKRVQKLYQEIYDKINVVYVKISMHQLNYNDIEEYLNNVYIPACIFYSLANCLCPNYFLDLITNKETDRFSNYNNKLLSKMDIEELMYHTLEFAFFEKVDTMISYCREQFWKIFDDFGIDELFHDL